MVVVQVAGGLFFAASTIYLLLALFGVLRFRFDGCRPLADAPGVTIMVPCHGAPPRLADCLRSMCRQDYPGPIQLVFGLHTAEDPARAVIEGVVATCPGLDAAVVVDERRVGSHPKACNLANMMTAVRHDVLVLLDSDVLVDPDFLTTIVASLEQPGVGAATCIYKGVPRPGLPSRLGACYINDWFIPSALVDVSVHGLGLTYGAATAVKRAVLDSFGGFEAMASATSSDYALGAEVRKAGWTITLAPTVVATVVDEDSLAGLYRHESRWMRAIRSTRPLDHALWICSSGLVPLMLLAPAWPWPEAAGGLGLYLGLRFMLHVLVRRRIALPPHEPFLLPLRDAVNFALWAGSLLGRRVRWGGNVMVTGRGNAMRTDKR